MAVHPVLDALEETLGGERRLVVVLVALLDVAHTLGFLGVCIMASFFWSDGTTSFLY